MQMCPFCDRVYDESDYMDCPYCSGEIELVTVDEKFKRCTECTSYMLWDGDCWMCVNCGHEDYGDENECDGTIRMEVPPKDEE